MPETPRGVSVVVLLTRRTVRETLDDNGLGLAAQLAYYFLLSLFPALIFVVALIGFLPIENVLDELLGRLASVVPQDVLGIIRGQLRSISQGEPAGRAPAQRYGVREGRAPSAVRDGVYCGTSCRT